MNISKIYTIHRHNGHVLVQSNVAIVTPYWYEGHSPPPYSYGDKSLGTHHLSVSILLDALGEEAAGLADLFAREILSKITEDEWAISVSMIREALVFFTQSHSIILTAGLPQPNEARFAALPGKPEWLSNINSSLRIQRKG